MGDIIKQICRLCLEAVPPGDGEAIEETKKEILKILVINIDFDISDNAVVCNRCVEKLQKCFDFKSTCFYVDDYIAPFMNADLKVDIKNVFQKQMITNENVDLENVQICRLCMLVIEDESFNYAIDSKDGVWFKHMIGSCLPEMDLNTVHEPLICKQCLSNIEKYNEFMKICREVEQRIQNYFQVTASYGKIVLENVLEFKYCDTLSQSVFIKEECSGVENVENDMNIMKCKAETHESAESGNSAESENQGNSSGKNGIPKKKRQIRKPGSREEEPQRFFCQRCPYSAYKYGTLMIHVRSHKDNEIHKCSLCPFVAEGNRAKILLSRHMRTHEGPSKTFGCCKCPYETNHRYKLTQHFIKHKDDSEVAIYQCKDCSFSTKYKRNFVRHTLKHKKPEEIRMFKCEKCEYQTRLRSDLKSHMLTHETTFKYKCEMCSYQFKRRDYLKAHVLTHLEDTLYRCDQCIYCSNVKRNLRIHKQVHIRDGERVTLQCDKCDFQTKSKFSLRDHKALHKPKKPKFKCDQCGYSVNKRHRLNRHLVAHMGLDEVVVYYCATCDFKTKYKNSLSTHVHKCLKRRKKNDEEH